MPCFAEIGRVRPGIVCRNSILATTWLLLVAATMAGCSSRSREQYQLPEVAQVAQPPEFLTGPAAVLLTNLDSYSARVSIERPGAAGAAHAKTGQLLGQGSQLIYAPAGSDKTYLWDVQRRSGFILSEALQGYAPFSSAIEVTNLTTISQTAGPASETINGHPGHAAQVAVAANDGTNYVFSVWRAADLNGFPVQIKSLTGPVEYTLNFSQVRPENLPPKLFLPPDGFIKYASAEAMANELLSRKNKARNPVTGGSSDFDRQPAGPAQRPY
jgi:hypothetical protein